MRSATSLGVTFLNDESLYLGLILSKGGSIRTKIKFARQLWEQVSPILNLIKEKKTSSSFENETYKMRSSARTFRYLLNHGPLGGELFYAHSQFSGTLTRGVFKSFRTGRLELELRKVQLSATRCSCIAILWASLVSFAAITLCVASQRVIPKASVYFVIDSIRKLLDTLSYVRRLNRCHMHYILSCI